MKSLKETIKQIYKEDKGLLICMVITLILGVFLFVYSILILDPDGSVLRIGYDDISRGYRNGAWNAMLVYPIAAVIFGVLHNMLAVRIFEKKGRGAAIVFLGLTIGIMIAMTLLMIRLVWGN